MGELAIPFLLDETAVVAFGQPSGPPASTRQIRELVALLQRAGHSDFRDARGPMGFTQRQAAGKFTTDEAATFIDRLQDAEPDESVPRSAEPTTSLSLEERAVRRVPDEILVVELRRRGWTVVRP